MFLQEISNAQFWHLRKLKERFCFNMRKILIVLFVILSLGITACSNTNISDPQTNDSNTPTPQVQAQAEPKTSNASGYTKLTPEEAKKRLDSDKGIVLLDVREQDEYTEGHIKNSILFPLGTIEADASAKLTDKNATIFVYCRSGRRSALAAEAFVKLGYTKVFDFGGIIDWPYEVITGE
jgi:phage shock protein E